ncbi:hypothetical protein [Flagellimonas sp. S3867]|uniref:hypothetical protein n=1 Tax=Flagellimonas sp. S3867 TaxID=2768063 RepID=UPI001689A853|nr:hypothetical protein [Flagellimonas sp. S3867]
MEKLEKHIKKTLEERRIVPSAQAWDKVSGQFKVPEKHSNNRWFMYSVAASFIGIILVSVFFFQTKKPFENTPQVVDKENPQEESVQPGNDNLVPLEMEQNQNEVTETDMKNIPVENSDLAQIASVTSKETISETASNQPLKDDILKTPDGLIAQKVNEVVAQVTLLENMNNEVSDVEIDSLLRAAQRQILSDKIFKSDKVDAMALLTEVEDELDESFRDQIFDALKDGYVKLRTAVADRNN